MLNIKFKAFEDLKYDTSLHYISQYLKTNKNYKIYHTIDDYFVNQTQLIALKKYSGDKLVLFSNGGHLGFLYRDEFKNELINDIKSNKINNQISFSIK